MILTDGPGTSYLIYLLQLCNKNFNHHLLKGIKIALRYGFKQYN
jgi:hypothetical protein